MAFQRGPNIVTKGLVLALDAGNPKSYVSGSTIWYDKSGNGNNGTLTNGPTFSSANAGSIVFDGVDDLTTFSGGTFNYAPDISGSISLDMWIYPTGPFTNYLAEPPATNLGAFIGQGYFNGTIGWGIGMVSSSAYIPTRQFQFQVRNLNTIVSSFAGFELNNWYYVVGSFSRTDFSRLYVNGSLISSASSAPLNGLTITPNLNDAGIGKINVFYSGFKISTARIYNRALSAQEVLQNYNAQKSRFNL